MTSRSFARSGKSWDGALRQMRGDRVARSPVREERLRTVAGTGAGVPLRLSAWRGRSGRRYVVAVYALEGALPADAPDQLFLGVRRDGRGIAVLLGIGHEGTVAEAAALARADGATELHVHGLEPSFLQRDAIVKDLGDAEEPGARPAEAVGGHRPSVRRHVPLIRAVAADPVRDRRRGRAAGRVSVSR